MSAMKVSKQLILAASGGPAHEKIKVRVTENEKKEIPPTDMKRMIEVAAYYRAQERQFGPGHELDDWLAAENEICTRYSISCGAS